MKSRSLSQWLFVLAVVSSVTAAGCNNGSGHTTRAGGGRGFGPSDGGRNPPPTGGGGYDDDGYDSGYDSGWDDPWGNNGGGYDDGGYDDGGYDDGGYDDGGYDDGGGGGCYTDKDGNSYCNSEGGRSRDVMTQTAEDQEARLAEVGQDFAQRFGLSDEQGLKLARTTLDFHLIKDRSASDLADFARRLYGVDPGQIVVAVGRAQLGDVAPLNELVEEAAVHFGTTPGNMKLIVKEFHGRALKDQGISL